MSFGLDQDICLNLKRRRKKKAQNYNHSLNCHLRLRVLASEDFWRRKEPLEMSLKGRNKGYDKASDKDGCRVGV